jgi:selenocysteine lyase/cysteine desulfurase
LTEIPGVTVCDRGRTQCGIVTFLGQGVGPEAVKTALARKRINVSVSDAAWTRIDMDARGIPALVRASVHYYNSEEEVDAFAAAVAALLGRSGATPPE